MNINDLARRTGRILQQNTPAILTALGSVGVVSTAYFAAKAGHNAEAAIVHREIEGGKMLTPKEKVELTWRFYIPVALMASGSVACIIGAQTVNSRRQAALISAVTFTERALSEYREKVVETIGEKKDQAIHDEIAKDRILDNPPTSENAPVIIAGKNVLCYDVLTGRYFESDYETVRSAMNDINEQCNNQDYASLNEFWNKVGLASLPMGEELGWNTQNMLQIDFSSMMSEDNRPVMAITFRNHPKPKYYTIWG